MLSWIIWVCPMSSQGSLVGVAEGREDEVIMEVEIRDAGRTWKQQPLQAQGKD